MTLTYDVVSDEFREISIPRESGPIVKALMEGKTLFMKVGDSKRLTSYYDTARNKGFRFRMKKGEIDGVIGYVCWFEPKESK